MPHYYFDLHDGAEIFRDSEGSACLDDNAAGVEAAYILTEIARDALPKDGLLTGS